MHEEAEAWESPNPLSRVTHLARPVTEPQCCTPRAIWKGLTSHYSPELALQMPGGAR